MLNFAWFSMLSDNYCVTVDLHTLIFLQGKLDGYRDEVRKGKELLEDQKAAIAKYDEVMQNLEFARELQVQFKTLVSDEERARKKAVKKEAADRAKAEANRLALILTYQKVIAAFAKAKVVEDFTSGDNGAVKLTKAQLAGIEDFAKTLACETKSGLDENDKAFMAASEHLIGLAEARAKKINNGKTS